MINLKNKQDCCGCSACAQRCPKQCISMAEDEEGFLYPQVDTSKCVDCHLCEKVCPVINQDEARTPLKVYAAKNSDDEIRLKSSSGGIFTLLAEQTIKDGGVVFGARYDTEWNVIHDYTETIEGLSAFRGSKYVQSNINRSFFEVKTFLESGRNVLFSGTPCQVAGLKLFLRKNYDNLLTVECACHGVPSPGLWQQYLKEQTAKDGRTIKNIARINFRNKETGWKRYSVSIEYEDGKKYFGYHGENPWTCSFINNLNLRPCCTKCSAKCNNSRADITLGDFWGADKFMPDNDDKGITLVICHTDRAVDCMMDIECKEYEMAEVLPYNKSLTRSTKENPKRIAFFRKATSNFIPTVQSLTKESLFLRLKLMVAKIIGR